MRRFWLSCCWCKCAYVASLAGACLVPTTWVSNSRLLTSLFERHSLDQAFHPSTKKETALCASRQSHPCVPLYPIIPPHLCHRQGLGCLHWLAHAATISWAPLRLGAPFPGYASSHRKRAPPNWRLFRIRGGSRVCVHACGQATV